MPQHGRDKFHFEGFENPRTTPTPDAVFDFFLSRLSGAELKVLLYIIRRTFGFHKDRDSISLSQITSGINTRDGRVLDEGTGLDRSSAIKATRGLEAMGIITVYKEKGADGVNLINVYGLHFRHSEGVPVGVVGKNGYGGGISPQGVVVKEDSQETDEQETAKQETHSSKFDVFEKSSNVAQEDKEAQRLDAEPAIGLDRKAGQDGQEIAKVVQKLTTFELFDVMHLRSNETQALNLWKKSKLSEEEFLKLLAEARRITLEAADRIHKRGNNNFGLKNRAPYFFRVLRNLVLEQRREQLTKGIRLRRMSNRE